jgi:hypothetical protein
MSQEKLFSNALEAGALRRALTFGGPNPIHQPRLTQEPEAVQAPELLSSRSATAKEIVIGWAIVQFLKRI